MNPKISALPEISSSTSSFSKEIAMRLGLEARGRDLEKSNPALLVVSSSEEAIEAGAREFAGAQARVLKIEVEEESRGFSLSGALNARLMPGRADPLWDLPKAISDLKLGSGGPLVVLISRAEQARGVHEGLLFQIAQQQLRDLNTTMIIQASSVEGMSQPLVDRCKLMVEKTPDDRLAGLPERLATRRENVHESLKAHARPQGPGLSVKS